MPRHLSTFIESDADSDRILMSVRRGVKWPLVVLETVFAGTTRFLGYAAKGVIADRSARRHNHGSAGVVRHGETSQTGVTNAVRERGRPFELHRQR